ncbi:hypothetical protein ACLX1H_002916 [Fusarium chlamydosporum]
MAEELLELRNEVEDLRVVLDQILEAKTTIETTSQHDAPFAAALNEQYQKANDRITRLEDILNALDGIKSYKKRYKWVRNEGKIDAMKMQIRCVRQTISSLLLTHGVIKSSRVELDILSVISVSNQQHQSVNSKLDALSSDISETQNQVSMAHSNIQDSAAVNSQQLVASFADSKLEVANMFRDFVSHLDTRFDRLGTYGAIPYRQAPQPAVRFQSLQFTTARRDTCSGACNCRCHSSSISSSSWQLPQILSFIMGNLFLQYTGWPARFVTCEPDCKTRQQTSLRFTYIFPIWFVQYSILFYFGKIAGRKPEMVLAIKNRVRWRDNPMFKACFFGSLKQVEMLYRTSPWYARDVRDLDGTNPIFWALHQQHVEVAKFLILVDGGVDNERDDGQCVKSQFAARTIANYAEPGVFDSEIHQLLRLREYIDEMELPEITRSILGLPRSRPLQHLIEDFPSRSSNEAKMEDELGKTALHWACRQGNDRAISQLLELGANINASTPGGSTPLHEAGSSKKPSECINILFDAGVVISRDIYGNTPLHVACKGGIVETVESLLDNDRGADMGAADMDGDTAFHWGVWKNGHECVRELLNRGVNTGVVDSNGTNPFHVAAEHGDERMLHILAKDGLRGLNIDAKDQSGRTAQQIFQSRAAVTNGLRSAFERLKERTSGLSTI